MPSPGAPMSDGPLPTISAAPHRYRRRGCRSRLTASPSGTARALPTRRATGHALHQAATVRLPSATLCSSWPAPIRQTLLACVYLASAGSTEVSNVPVFLPLHYQLCSLFFLLPLHIYPTRRGRREQYQILHNARSNHTIYSFSSANAITASADSGCAAKRRHAPAVFGSPQKRINDNTAFLKTAMICGMCPF